VNPENKDTFKAVSPERSVAYLFPDLFHDLIEILQGVRGFRSRVHSASFLRVQFPRMNVSHSNWKVVLQLNWTNRIGGD
jgi:hypothetical protein